MYLVFFFCLCFLLSVVEKFKKSEHVAFYRYVGQFDINFITLLITHNFFFVLFLLMLMFIVTFEATDPGPKLAAPSPFGHLGAHREGGAF